MARVDEKCFVPHKPVGERCSHAQISHDGRPNNTWSFSVREAHAEINDLHNNALDPKLTFAEHVEYAGQLQQLMLKATLGTIVLSKALEGNVIRERLVELKPLLQQQRPAFGRKPRLLRLYFGEPEIHPQMLLALRLSTKEQSDSGLDEQNADIEMALQRVEDWCLGAIPQVVSKDREDER